MALNAGIDFTGSGTTAFGEQPSGTVDGVNDTFTLAHAPSPASSLHLYKNGLLQHASGNDFTLSGTTITFVTDAIPLSSDSIMASYTY